MLARLRFFGSAVLVAAVLAFAVRNLAVVIPVLMNGGFISCHRGDETWWGSFLYCDAYVLDEKKNPVEP